MVQHYCHGITISKHPFTVRTHFNLIKIKFNGDGMRGDGNSMAIMLDHRSTASGRYFKHREFWILFCIPYLLFPSYMHLIIFTGEKTMREMSWRGSCYSPPSSKNIPSLKYSWYVYSLSKRESPSSSWSKYPVTLLVDNLATLTQGS